MVMMMMMMVMMMIQSIHPSTSLLFIPPQTPPSIHPALPSPQMKSRGAFRVLTDGYVSSDAGTGVVHQAPYFGEVGVGGKGGRWVERWGWGGVGIMDGNGGMMGEINRISQHSLNHPNHS